MSLVARVPLAFALVSLTAACAAAPNESSSESATISTAPISSATSAPTDPPSATADPSNDASDTAEGDTTVEIVGFVFAPDELTITAGSEVTFINLDDFSHTATAGTADDPMPDVFDSGRLPKDDSFSHVFSEAGTIEYYCAVHPSMEGTITVEE